MSVHSVMTRKVKDFLALSSATDSFTKVPQRGILEIEGNDAVKFLQGLCTNHMPHIQYGGDGILALFLSAQGRVLYDAFIYPKNVGTEFPRPTFLVETDARITQDLLKHMKRYLLRTKVRITDMSNEYTVWQAWGPTTLRLWGNYVPTAIAHKLPAGGVVPKDRFCDIGTKDPRHLDMGLRFVLGRDQKPPLPNTFAMVDPDEYTLRRILYGIPEGSDELFIGNSLPLESNFDYMRGVDFRKGCYLGQELTIRTYHTGVTRKRIMPVQFFKSSDESPSVFALDRSFGESLPPSQSDFKLESSTEGNSAAAGSSTGTGTASANAPTKRGDRAGTAGKFCSGMFNVGLGLIRLEHAASGSVLMAENGLKAKAFAPDWWPM
ncbi:ccr4 associated factor [Quaeritorhiza haematococci]|nr:ccr4 associated factor [Quaeritorhiza haematococci]